MSSLPLLMPCLQLLGLQLLGLHSVQAGNAPVAIAEPASISATFASAASPSVSSATMASTRIASAVVVAPPAPAPVNTAQASPDLLPSLSPPPLSIRLSGLPPIRLRVHYSSQAQLWPWIQHNLRYLGWAASIHKQAEPLRALGLLNPATLPGQPTLWIEEKAAGSAGQSRRDRSVRWCLTDAAHWRTIKRLPVFPSAASSLATSTSSPSPADHPAASGTTPVPTGQPVGCYRMTVVAGREPEAADQLVSQTVMQLINWHPVLDQQIALILKHAAPQAEQYQLVITDAQGRHPVTVLNSSQPLEQVTWGPDQQSLFLEIRQAAHSGWYRLSLTTGSLRLLMYPIAPGSSGHSTQGPVAQPVSADTVSPDEPVHTAELSPASSPLAYLWQPHDKLTRIPVPVLTASGMICTATGRTAALRCQQSAVQPVSLPDRYRSWRTATAGLTRPVIIIALAPAARRDGKWQLMQAVWSGY